MQIPPGKLSLSKLTLSLAANMFGFLFAEQMLQWDVQVLICAHGKVFEVRNEEDRTEIHRALDLTDSLAITA